MLEIKDISKEYRTGDLVQKALDHVSLNLRDNEFVAILGPSGSGKTTLLNIIGGLDRYDSGDLVINGISTKKYKDRDWDSYRNHTIGFVFQSYNLIPHQTLLANVELALTISGISGKERTRRAQEALEKVGLGDQSHKKPNQLSGGQMQRVALARALVNDPDILLADEPTGALDSETSVQVMELLKEVADDRLVVMVTHNPELAEQYATRIVKLKDGVIRSDTDPFVPETSVDAVHKNMGKSSMSFLTALQLSMNNLLTKKARTILVAFAGSIGIIGIALILSLSNGVNNYISKTEEETLSEYPLEITKQAMDLSGMIENSGMINTDQDEEDSVRIINVASSMFEQITSNDLSSLKSYLVENQDEVDKYARSVEYRYGVTPILYLSDTEDGVYQVNPDNVLSSTGMMSSSMMSSSYSMSSFSVLPADSELYEEAYEIQSGRWPTAYDEAVLVLTSSGGVSDMTLYALGLRDYSDYQDMVKSYLSGSETEEKVYNDSYTYEDFLNVTYKLVNAYDYYAYDETLGMWVSKADDADYVKNLVDNGEEIRIVGVVKPAEDTNVMMLSTGINYSSLLQNHIMDAAEKSEIVKAQLADQDINVFTGESFTSENDTEFDMSSIFSVDEDALARAFAFDTSALSFDSSSMNIDMSTIDLSSLSSSVSIDPNALTKILSSINIDTSNVDLIQIATDLFEDFLENHSVYADLDTKIADFFTDSSEKGARAILSNALQEVLNEESRQQLVDALTQMNEDLMRGYLQSPYYDPEAEDPLSGYSEYLQSEEAQLIISEAVSQISVLSEEQIAAVADALMEGFTDYTSISLDSFTKDLEEYMTSESASTIIMNDLMSMIDMQDVERQVSDAVNAQMAGVMNQMSGAMESAMSQIMNSIQNSLVSSMGSLSSQMQNAFSFDPTAFQDAIQINMDQSTMTSAMMALSSSSTSSYEDNLSTLGYAKEEEPTEIIMYPRDFDSKTQLKDMLEEYNTSMSETGHDEKVIVYTDLVGTMMASVTDIINVISYILIAFVAISLVVSSIMIGVITYISVLERQKEIGILRAIGASKRNISNVFNAETFITGLLAGVFGIGLTQLILIPGNMIIHNVVGNSDVTAALPPSAGGFLIVLSIILTLIGGIIPSRKAASSDPVKALRTD